MASTLTAKQLAKALKSLQSAPQNNKTSTRKARKGRSHRQAKRENAMSAMAGLAPLVSAPAAMARSGRMSKINGGKQKASDGRVSVKEREYIGEVSGSVAFGVTSYSINPGLSSIFPWLSLQAPQYESYRFKRLSFIYSSEKSSSTNGSVYLAIDFDAADSSPVSKQEFMANWRAVRSPVWQECCYEVDVKDLHKFNQLFIRQTTVSGTDIKTYDLGNFLVGTYGMADTSAVGELYVDYEVELITPQYTPPLLNPRSNKIVSSGSVSRAAPFGSSATVTGALGATASAATLTIPVPCNLLLEMDFVGTVLTSTAPTVTGTASATQILSGGFQLPNAAATYGTNIWVVSTSAANQTLIFDFTAACTTLTSATWRLAQYKVSLGEDESDSRKVSQLEERVQWLEARLRENFPKVLRADDGLSMYGEDDDPPCIVRS